MVNIDNRIKSHYPQFGEKTAIEEPLAKKIAKRVGLVASFTIAGALVGALSAGAPGALLGASIGVITITCLASLKTLIERIRQLSFFSQIPHQERSGSGVGKYQLAHARLACSSQEALEWKEELIRSAKRSLELSANFGGGSCFREVLALIEQKMESEECFKTHLLLSIDFLEKEDIMILKRLQKRFSGRFELLITDRHYRISPQLHSEENHVKLLIADGRYFISGGSGIHPRLSSDQIVPQYANEKPTRTALLLEKSAIDMDIVAESIPLATTLREQFFHLYQIWETRTTKKVQKSRHFPLTGEPGCSTKFKSDAGLYQNVRLKCIVGGPEHRGKNPIEREYAKRIAKSTQEVRLANLMFTPPRAIRQALTQSRANHPGKRHIAYLAGLGPRCTLGRKMQVLSSRAYYSQLDKVYEYKSDFQMYHKKVATFDETHLIVGSFNLGEKSAKHDHEIAFVLKDGPMTQELKRVLKIDGHHSTKLRPRSQRGSLPQKAASILLAKSTANFI